MRREEGKETHKFTHSLPPSHDEVPSCLSFGIHQSKEKLKLFVDIRRVSIRFAFQSRDVCDGYGRRRGLWSAHREY